MRPSTSYSAIFHASLLGAVFSILLFFGGALASDAGGDSKDASRNQRARQYALDFTQNFVAESCYPAKCRFTADEKGGQLSEHEGKISISIEGQRERIQGWEKEIRRVRARLILKPLPAEPDLPYGFVVLDFSFSEGASIPLPTK